MQHRRSRGTVQHPEQVNGSDDEDFCVSPGHLEGPNESPSACFWCMSRSRDALSLCIALRFPSGRRHFEEGQKLNDPVMLREAAEEVGIDGDAAAAFMESDRGSEEIRSAQRMLRDMGIHSIPTFVVQGRYIMNGAVQSGDMVELFRQIERNEEEGEPVFAECLGIPEERIEEGLEVQAAAAVPLSSSKQAKK